MKVDLTKDASAVADTDVETIPATPADETVVEETVAESSFAEKIPEVLEGNIFAGAIGGLLSSVPRKPSATSVFSAVNLY